jgi:hypothetical protein
LKYQTVAWKERSGLVGLARFRESVSPDYTAFHPGYKQHWPETRMDIASQAMPCQSASAVRLVARQVLQRSLDLDHNPDRDFSVNIL